MKFAVYTGWDQLPQSADALFEGAERDSIFFSRPWLENVAAAAIADHQDMLLAGVVAGDKVKALLPLLTDTGDTGYALIHRYTTHYSLLLAKDDRQQVLDCLAHGLSQSPMRALLLEPVADDDDSINALQAALEGAGYRCERGFRLYNWILRLGGQSFEDYMAARPARLRNTIARKRRKLQREHGYEIRLFRGEEVPGAMAHYHAAYRASWKADEQYADLLERIVAGFSRRGWTRLAVLYVAAQPVAAQLWFVAHGKASIFRLAYDKAWRRYSPGSILTGFLMEYVIDVDRVEEVDFLTGNEAYKQDWMSERRERFALSCVRDVNTGLRRRGVLRFWKDILKTG